MSCGGACRSQIQAAKAAVDLAQHQVKIEAAEAALKDHAQVRGTLDCDGSGFMCFGLGSSCLHLCAVCTAQTAHSRVGSLGQSVPVAGSKDTQGTHKSYALAPA